MKKTEFGNSYWNKTGSYQSEYNDLYDKLVPPSGCAATLHGELIRAASRLTHEYYNNGNCNARDFQRWGGVADFYREFTVLIDMFVPGTKDVTEKVRHTISSVDCKFGKKEAQPYSELMDLILYYVQNNNDSSIPIGYANK